MKVLSYSKILFTKPKLIKATCPGCGQEILTGFPLTYCELCKFDISEYYFEEPLTRCKMQHFETAVPKRKKISKKTVRFLLEHQEWRCAYCDKDLRISGMHVEHIIPWSFSQDDRLSNLVMSCPRCNLLASNLIFNNFSDKQLYILGKI